MKTNQSKNIAIFASGSGSNAENIYNYFIKNESVKVKYLVCNNPCAGVLKRFENTGVEILQITKSELSTSDFISKLGEIDLIVLAGFLALIPIDLVRAFPNKIINIHPSLLPKYGGKGMYGDHIHNAVLENNEFETGITIHYVNEEFDKGEIIFQAKCEIKSTDKLKEIQIKIHGLEFDNFPIVIEKILN